MNIENLTFHHWYTSAALDVVYGLSMARMRLLVSMINNSSTIARDLV